MKESTIREKASNILGIYIPKGGWRRAMLELNQEGRLDTKVLISLLILVMEYLEETEAQG